MIRGGGGGIAMIMTVRTEICCSARVVYSTNVISGLHTRAIITKILLISYICISNTSVGGVGRLHAKRTNITRKQSLVWFNLKRNDYSASLCLYITPKRSSMMINAQHTLLITMLLLSCASCIAALNHRSVSS